MPDPRLIVRACFVIVAFVLASRQADAKTPLFNVAFADGNRVVLFDTESGDSRVLADPFFVDTDSAAVSPDGRQLAFVRRDVKAGYKRLYVTPMHRFEPVPVGAATGGHRDPAWSPDGKRLAFGLHPNSRYWDPHGAADPAQVFELELSTGALTRLSPSGACFYFPSYLPNGDEMLLTKTDCLTHWNVARLFLPNRRVRSLTVGPVRDHQPVPSPDGQHYAYLRLEKEGGVLVIASLRGAPPRTVTRLSRVHAVQPRWSRDGKRLFWFAQHAIHSVDVMAQNASPRIVSEK